MSDSRISFADLNDLPLDVISQLTKNEIVRYLKSLRGDHNRYKSIYESQKEKADRLSIEVAEARSACKKLKDQSNELLEEHEWNCHVIKKLHEELCGLAFYEGSPIHNLLSTVRFAALEKARGEG